MTQSSSEMLPSWLDGPLGTELRYIRLRILAAMDLLGPMEAEEGIGVGGDETDA